MRKFILTAIFIFAGYSFASAQPSLGVFLGYGVSSFDKELVSGVDLGDAAGYLPVGVQVGYSLTGLSFGSLSFLGEFNYSAVPFTYETFGDIGNGEIKTSEIMVSQTFIGAVFKMKFGTSFFNPFIRLGGGAYLGSVNQEFTQDVKDYLEQFGATIEDADIDFKTAFGFNIGAGTDIRIGQVTGLFGEFVYHIVSRELDIDGAESNSANNWAILVGFQISI